MPPGSRTIEMIIAGRYEGRQAFQAAASDMQALLAQAKDSRQTLNPFGRLVAGAEQNDTAVRAAMESRASAQASLSQELARAQGEARTRGLAQEQAAIMAAAKQEHAVRQAQGSMMAELNAAAAQSRSTAIQKEQAAIMAAAQKEHALRQAQANDSRSLANQLYAATHTAREMDLRSARQYYARLRLEHRGNADMLAKIDRAYQAQRQTILASGGDAGGGFFGGKNRQAFQRNAQYIATNAAMGAGGEVGMMAGNLMAFGLVGGGIAAGVMAIGTAYRSAREEAERLRQSQRDYTKEIQEAARFSQRMWGEQGSARGDTVRDRMDALRQRNEEIRRASMDRVGNLGLMDSAGIMARAAWNGGVENTDFGRAVASDVERVRAGEDELAVLKKRAEMEDRHDKLARKWDALGAVESARLAAMVDGPEKERLQLLQRQSEERRKAMESEMLQPGRIDLDALEQRQAHDRVALERRQSRAVLAETHDVTEARIRAYRTGYDQELALLQHKHIRELEEYIAAGRDITRLVERQAAEQAAGEAARVRELQETQQSLEDRLLLAQGGDRGGIEERNLRKQLALRGATNAEIERTIALLQAAQHEEKKNSNEDLAYQVVEARLRLIEDGTQRELAMLALKHAKERQQAEEAGLDLTLLAAKQAAERQGLLQQAGPKTASLVDRGFLTYAPGQVDPMREMRDYQKQNAVLAAAGNQLSSQAVALLRDIAAKLDLPIPPVANF